MDKLRRMHHRMGEWEVAERDSDVPPFALHCQTGPLSSLTLLRPPPRRDSKPKPRCSTAPCNLTWIKQDAGKKTPRRQRRTRRSLHDSTSLKWPRQCSCRTRTTRTRFTSTACGRCTRVCCSRLSSLRKALLRVLCERESHFGWQELEHDMRMKMEHGLEHGTHHLKGVEDNLRLLDTQIREVQSSFHARRAPSVPSCAHPLHL